jgi:3-deoxy-D-manno-octulosonic-acid transferase
MTNNNSNHAPNSLFRYQLLLWAAAIPIVCYTLWQALRFREFRYLRQRLGFGYRTPAQPAIWLHAASVGEVLAAEPLIKALDKNYPDTTIVVTTVTPTGAEMVRQRFAGQIKHIYLPVDWRSAVQRFLKLVKPRLALIMETELWPNLYDTCARLNHPLLIINARVSSKTLNTHGWIRDLYHNTLSHVTGVLARSQPDADGFVNLGASLNIVRVIGNIKFSAAKPVTDIKPIKLPRPLVLAASTHEDEEFQLASMWLAMQPRDELLVIAPRHPNRSSSIIKQLNSLSVKFAVRSRNDSIHKTTQVYLADTLGELTGFMASAELVVMGGSFVPVGGHNILEPAMLGKAMLFGPHMQNFAEETEGLLEQQAGIQVDDYQQLQHQIDELLQDKAKRQLLGERAEIFMQQNSGILDRYISEIKTCYQPPDE